MIGTIWLGHRTLRGAVPVLYGLSVVLILLVLTPLGATINGAHAWIVIGGGFSLQPSEFVKITIILGMAMLLAARVDAGDKLHPDHRTVAKALGLAAAPDGIVMLMPDLGSVMVMVVIVLGVLLASGASNRWVLGLIGAGVGGAVAGHGSSASSTSTRSTASRPSPTPTSTRPASATTPTRRASRSAPAASSAPGSSRAPRPPASSCPSSRRTSSSRWRGRSWASSAPA